MAAIGTTIDYNGVSIYGCTLLSFDQQQIRDDSGADRAFDRLVIKVRGTVHLFPAVTHGTSTDAGTLSARFDQITRAMMENRRVFTMWLNNNEKFLQIGPVDQSVSTISQKDVCNGPHPIGLQIIKVISNRMLLVEYSIELCVVTCKNLKNKQGVLSNRWGFTDVQDANWFIKRVFRGRLKVASANLNPQAFRSMVFPKLQKGFKRELIEVTTTTDGLNLDYTVVDAQIKYACPFPGTTVKGTHIVSQSIASGLASIIKVDITVFGPPDVNKDALLVLATKIAQDRTQYEAAGNNAYVQDYTLIDYIDDTSNAVGVSVTTNIPGNITGQALLKTSTIGKPFGSTIAGYDRKTARNPPPYGTTTATGLFICYLQEPCDDKHSVTGAVDGTTKDSKGNGYGNDGTTVVTNSTDKLPNYPAPYSAEHKEHLYTFYQVDRRYDERVMAAQMGVGYAKNGSSQSIGVNDTSTVVFLTRGTAGVSRMIIRAAGERIGKMPVAPAAARSFKDANGILYTLLDAKAHLGAPELSSDGQKYTYTIAAEYVYSMSRGLGDADNIPLATMPWLANNQGSVRVSNITSSKIV